MVVAEPLVSKLTQVVVHLDDHEIHLGHYLPRNLEYRWVTLLSEAEQWVGDPSVVAFIMDVVLPGERESGGRAEDDSQKSTDLIQHIREEYPEIPILVLTGHQEDDDLSTLIKSGHISRRDVFAKISYDPRELVGRLVQALEEPAPSLAKVATPQQKLDPRLRWLISKAKKGVPPPRTPSTEPGEIPILAEVSDLEAWNRLGQKEELRRGVAIPQGQGKGWLVTGRVHWSKIEEISQLPFVLGIEGPEPLSPAMKATLRETSARRDLMPPLLASGAGRGAVVGVVDTGFAFAHYNFRHPNGTTRVLAIWDQKGNAQGPSEVDYGRLYRSDEISAALGQKDPYAKLEYYSEDPTHGTHVLDIAAGNGGGNRGTRVEGVAGDAEIALVDLQPEDDPWITSRFGDSIHLVEALELIFRTAGDRPCVINVSLGTSGGPHDGTRRVDRVVDALVEGAPNRAVVAAAGNFYGEGKHTTGKICNGEATELVWDLDWERNKPGEVAVEIWYPGEDTCEAELLDPGGESLGRFELSGEENDLSLEDRSVFQALLIHGKDGQNSDNFVAVFLTGEAAEGTWRLRLHGKRIYDGAFHAWLGSSQARVRFTEPCEDSCTLGSLATGRQVIVAAAYDANQDRLPVCSFSSAGPTRDGRQKPELSAPGENVHAARAACTSCTVASSGTSMAAPAVAGVVAILLAEARAYGMLLTNQQVHELLNTAARRHGDDWDPRVGWGRLDARAAVLALHSLCTGAPPQAADPVGSPVDAPA